MPISFPWPILRGCNLKCTNNEKLLTNTVRYGSEEFFARFAADENPSKTVSGIGMSWWVFPKIGVLQNGWFIMENLIKMDDLGVPLFSETSWWNLQ